jgi:uncharacterized protein YigA (DUF484 family)
MTKSQKIFSAVAVLVILTSAIGTLPAYAASSSTNSTPNFFQGLVQFIAQKFGIDQGQVQNDVNSYHIQHVQQVQQKMQKNDKKRLDTLVSQGKITTSQEQQILDEQSKLKSEYNPQDFKTLTQDQRRAKFQQEQAEIQAWSSSTGIDKKYLGVGLGAFGRMRMFNRWNKNGGGDSTPTPSPSV